MTFVDTAPWVVAVASSGALAIWGKDSGRLSVHRAFKPVPLSVLFAYTLGAFPEGPLRTSLLAALGLSLLGDVLLMLPSRFFAAGLVSFLFAHVAYVATFTVEVPFTPGQLCWAPLPIAAGILILRYLWPHLGSLRAGVALYVVMLGLMTWRALSRFDAPEVSLGAWIAGVVGASLFVLGDLLLARRRFVGKAVPYAIELGAYFVAQGLLVASLTL